jgi:DNA-binding HxlR family transcriptional regulator
MKEVALSENEVGRGNAALDWVLNVLGDRWTLLILSEIGQGACRFNHIQRNTGMSRDRLTLRLRRMENQGLICRRRYCDRPPRFEYGLAEAGRALGPSIDELRKWGTRYSPSGEHALLRGPLVAEHDEASILRC